MIERYQVGASVEIQPENELFRTRCNVTSILRTANIQELLRAILMQKHMQKNSSFQLATSKLILCCGTQQKVMQNCCHPLIYTISNNFTGTEVEPVVFPLVDVFASAIHLFLFEAGLPLGLSILIWHLLFGNRSRALLCLALHLDNFEMVVSETIFLRPSTSSSAARFWFVQQIEQEHFCLGAILVITFSLNYLSPLNFG